MTESLRFRLRYIPKIFSPSKTFKININGSKFIVRPRTFDMGIVREIFIDNEYNPQATNLKNVKTIVDLGAHIGIFSVWAYKKYQPEKVVSVEPEKENYALLQKNIKLNDASHIIKPHNTAIYHSETNVGIKKWRYNKGMHSLNTNVSTNILKTTTLENIFDRYMDVKVVDYLKIDIEGSEKHILTPKNAKLFQDRVRYVVLETHRWSGFSKSDALSYFTEIGFKCKARRVLWLSTLFGVDIVEAVNTDKI